MTIGSLFAGIGGLELGLESAGLGPVRWQVESDPLCRAVLEQHWPAVKRYDDVRSVGAATLASVDIVCGGFPCQDVSSAGKRVGLGGARSGLWFEFRRIVSELQPQWVVVENVASGAVAWVDAVSEGLGELGYAVLPIPLSAADVGAPHERARVFLVAAHAHGAELRHEPRRSSRSRGQGPRVAADDGKARVVAADADAVRQHAFAEHAEVGSASTAADALRARSEGALGQIARGQQQPPVSSWGSPVPDVLRVAHGVSGGLDAAHSRRQTRIEAAGGRQRIQALGNAVVPQCAEVIGHVIRLLQEPPA